MFSTIFCCVWCYLGGHEVCQCRSAVVTVSLLPSSIFLKHRPLLATFMRWMSRINNFVASICLHANFFVVRDDWKCMDLLPSLLCRVIFEYGARRVVNTWSERSVRWNPNFPKQNVFEKFMTFRTWWTDLKMTCDLWTAFLSMIFSTFLVFFLPYI